MWRCLLLQRTTVSRQVHSLGHWGLGTQLDSSWPGKTEGIEVSGESDTGPVRVRRDGQEGKKRDGDQPKERLEKIV